MQPNQRPFIVCFLSFYLHYCEELLIAVDSSFTIQDVFAFASWIKRNRSGAQIAVDSFHCRSSRLR